MATAASSVPSVPSVLSSSFELTGHTNDVTALVGHPFLPILVLGSDFGVLHLWDLETRSCVRTLEGHTDMVFAVAFDPTGRRLASGSYDNTVRLWDLDLTKETCLLHTLRDDTMRFVQAVAWHPLGTLVASASLDKHVRVWDAVSGSLLYTLEGHSDWVRALASHPTDDLFASASNDMTVRVWRWSSGESVHTLRGHTGWVASLAASATFLVSGSYDKTVRVWSWTTGLCARAIDGFVASPCTNSSAWQGSKLVVSDHKGNLHVWDTSDEDPKKWSCVMKLLPSSKSSFFHCNTAILNGGAIARVAIDDDARVEVWENLADDD